MRESLCWRDLPSVRNVGADGYADMALRDAINDGDVIGPRMQVVGADHQHHRRTRRHQYISIRLSYFQRGSRRRRAGRDGESARRNQVRRGRDQVRCVRRTIFRRAIIRKIEAFSPEEMQALIAEAHREGRKVATHAHATIAIKDAVRAGVDSIEHGIFLDEEGIQLMKQHGTYLSATTYPLFWYEKNEESLHMPPWVVEKVAIIIPAAKVNVARAYREGVKVALGTDAGVLSARDERLGNSGRWSSWG